MFTFPECGQMILPFACFVQARPIGCAFVRADRALIGSGADRQSYYWRRRARFSPVLLVVGV